MKKLKQKNNLKISSTPSIFPINAEELLKKYKVDLNQWTIKNKSLNSWNVLQKNGVKTLFQTKVDLEKNYSRELYNQIRNEFIEFSKKIKKPFTINPKKPNKTPKKLLEINLFDFHFGKMSWNEETGYNFDTKIASNNFENAIDNLILKVKHYNIDKILFPIGNDFFNSDYSHPYNRTTNGTPQEEDLRWQKTFREGRELLIKSINKLLEIAPVDILIIPGNHDYEKTFYLGDSLTGWFNTNPNVNINNSANPRKYYKYNNVLLGFTHGNNEKVESLPLIMSQECSNDWGNTKYREFHLGHYHHKKSISYNQIHENNGVNIKYFSSISPADSWHHKKGFIGSNKQAEALIWDEKDGLEAQIYYNIK